ncbi:MAG: dienelactone hydrolase family protein [Bacteroidia bacterium]
MESKEISVPVSKVSLLGNLVVPEGAESFVIFSHGSGSSRFSVRNQFVAGVLNRNKIATLLTDLLTEEEDKDYDTRFNIELLTERLITVTNHSLELRELAHLPVGYFGASTGAASALKAAAQLPDLIKAVVSRGGRPDLAGADLEKIEAPTLLIVGSLDTAVIELNRQAFEKIRGAKKKQIINGATHLFEEPGKLDEVADYATTWFNKYLLKTSATYAEDLSKK